MDDGQILKAFKKQMEVIDQIRAQYKANNWNDQELVDALAKTSLSDIYIYEVYYSRNRDGSWDKGPLEWYDDYGPYEGECEETFYPTKGTEQ